MNRINQIVPYSFILCILVVIIHNPTSKYFDYGANTSTYIVHYLINDVIPTITSIAVPAFYIISAFLFFRNYRIQDTKQKLQSRVKTLVLPYLFWNLVGLLIVMAFKLPFIASMSVDSSNPFDIVTICKALFLHRYTPFWFVFGLIVYNLFCPIIYKICTNKLIGLSGGVILYMLICQIKIDNPLPEGCYFEVNSFFYYYVGAFVGVNYKHLLEYNISKRLSIVSLIVFLLLLWMQLNWHIKVVDLPPVVTLIKCILSWCMLYPLLTIIKTKWYMNLTFFIYATHIVIQRIIATILRLLICKTVLPTSISESVVFASSVVLAICTCIWIAKYWKRKSEKTFVFVTGNRT